jgi:hypothetical protein
MMGVRVDHGEQQRWKLTADTAEPCLELERNFQTTRKQAGLDGERVRQTCNQPHPVQTPVR